MLSQIKYIKYLERDFKFIAWVMPQGVGLGGAGVPRGSKKYFFLNMVMWQIKLTGITSRTECK